MGSTTPYGLRYPEYATGADPKRDIQYLAEDVAPKLHRAEPLTTAQITAISSPRVGQLAMNTDTGRVLYYTGASWRPIGGGASGSTTIAAQSLTQGNYVTVAVFVGLGFEEVTFSLHNQFTAIVSASANTAIVGNYSMSSATDTFTLNGGSPQTSLSVRNVRLDADGYFRYEITSQSGNTTFPASRINWRAR